MRESASNAPRPLFSIVTVCRNAVRSIRRTIQSVLDQTDLTDRSEHIVIDGVSTDGTLQVLEQFPHLRIVSERDAGIYDAMNKGVSRARGDYVGILNADDWYQPDTLATVAEEFRAAPEASIVHGDIRTWRGDTPIDVVKPASRGSHGTLVMPVHHPACFARRDLFTRFGGFDTSYSLYADYDWVSRVIKGGALLRYCPRVLANFTVGGATTKRLAIREQYRVFRAHGASAFATLGTIGYASAAVIRRRLWNAHR